MFFVARRAQRLGYSITSAPAVAIVLAVDESLSRRCGGDRIDDRRVAHLAQSKALAARPVRQPRRRRPERKVSSVNKLSTE